MGKATELSHRAKVFVGGEEYVPKVLFVEYIDEQLSKMREDCENKINDDSPEWMRIPREQEYNSVNFETIGKCPRCGAAVSDSISGRDINCGNCNLELFWV